MSVNRSALVDLAGISSSQVDIQEYLVPSSEGRPKTIASKPNAVDPHDDTTIDTNKWSVTGAVTEGPYLGGSNGLIVTGPGSPDWDAAGVIYKPAISAQVGKVVFARAQAGHPMEFAFVLQEYAFTVDNVVTPLTWTLKHKVVQDLRNSMGLLWRAGHLFFFEGGQGGTEEHLIECPWRGGKSGGPWFPIQAAFVFTATGWEIWVHLPGVWSQAVKVKEYTRPSSQHAVNGYSFCVNARTADDTLMHYNLAFNFMSSVVVTGARVVTANILDYIYPSSLQVGFAEGRQAGQPGNIRVRFPDIGTTLYDLDDLAQITQHLTGKQVYAVDFELNGDAALLHPARINIDDATLSVEATANGT